jgi:hypothetical protein
MSIGRICPAPPDIGKEVTGDQENQYAHVP